jgi:hypothetical protein
MLVEVSLTKVDGYELICPVIYNYRHATELYLKAIVGTDKQTHDLKALLEEVKVALLIKFQTTLPTWFENTVLAMNDFDPYGTTFRYGGLAVKDEIFADIRHLKTLMGWQASAVQRIRQYSL